MSDNTSQRASSIRSISSIDSPSRGSGRIPPVPPPKPKISAKNGVDAGPRSDPTRAGDKLAVRQAILRGSRNPTGSSCDEHYDDVIRDIQKLSSEGSWQQQQQQQQQQGSPLLDFPRTSVNSLCSRSSVISNEERDANLDIIFSDWNSKTFSQRQSSFETFPNKLRPDAAAPADEFQRHSFHSSGNFNPKSQPEQRQQKQQQQRQPQQQQNRIDGNRQNPKADSPSTPSPVNSVEKKHGTENDSDADYLLPRLEKQSNRVVVLAENSPTDLKEDVVRNCDALEEQVPQSGHTGHLLKYWKFVEASPEKDVRKSTCQSHPDGFVVKGDADLHTSTSTSTATTTTSNTSSAHEQDLNEILQEFENFNLDFLDSNIFLEQTTSKVEVTRPPARSNDVEEYDILPSDLIKEEENRADFKPTDQQQQQQQQQHHHHHHQQQHDEKQDEEGVYSELDEEPARETSKKKSVEPSAATTTTSTQEINSEKVTLIGFRKLNSLDDNSEASNSSIKNFPSISPSSSSSCYYGSGSGGGVTSTSQNNVGVKVDVSEDERKKNSAKQKCLIM